MTIPQQIFQGLILLGLLSGSARFGLAQEPVSADYYAAPVAVAPDSANGTSANGTSANGTSANGTSANGTSAMGTRAAEASYETGEASVQPVALESATTTGGGCSTGGCGRCAACKAGGGGGKGGKKPNPCVTSHKTVFYDNDFSYLNDPNFDGCCLGDCLKQWEVGCCGKLDVGGQVRFRYHHELGMKGIRFQDNVDDFLLTRLRLYGDYHVNPWFRLYAEGIYAESSGQSLPPRIIDLNYGDLLNAFIDVKVTENTTFRAGRQELLYGAQRVVSPLDWANTRRTFEGLKLMYRSDNWAVDGFYTHLVIPDATEFDEAEYDLPLYGAWAVYNGFSDATLDLFYLGSERPLNLGSVHTFGSRLFGNRGDWLYELEGAYQTGDSAGADQDDGFVTVGLGRKLAKRCWKPTVWFYFDYASENYDQLYPLAHKYLGFIDAVARSNIISPNVLLTADPTDKIKLLLWYYHFQSATAAPVFSIGGTPPQNANRYLGNEVDFLVKYQVRPSSDVLIGYSHFWRGTKIDEPSNDADFVYVQWTTNF